jgi:GDP-4-dehydro-6-deoxy-D-mannose reductase
MMRILITGVAGFVGAHLAHHLKSRGHQLFGTDRVAPKPSEASVAFYPSDICNKATISRVLVKVQPDVIYHLAGVLKSSDANQFYTVHVLGTVALFEAIVNAGIKPNVIVTSSSAVYGHGRGNRPLTEQVKPQPITHYALSKIAQEAVALRYYRACQLPVVITRTFNIIGPRQPPDLACSAFARQIALAEQLRNTTTIMTGGLGAKRDFIDVRDAVRAYEIVARLGQPGTIYNICSEKAVSIQQCFKVMMKMSKVALQAEVDPSRVQPNDVPIQVGSAARIRAHMGWRPKITLSQSLQDLLNYWREAVKSHLVG